MEVFSLTVSPRTVGENAASYANTFKEVAVMHPAIWMYPIGLLIALLLGTAFALPVTAKLKPGHRIRSAALKTFAVVASVFLLAGVVAIFMGPDNSLGSPIFERVLGVGIAVGVIAGGRYGIHSRRRGMLY